MIDPVALGTAATAVWNQGVGSSAAVDGTAAGVSETPFASVLQDALVEMGTLQEEAHTKMTAMLAGDGVDVHTAMIASQRSGLAFQLALAVRNKAVDAYNQLNAMQF
ncbi:MAG TPA: flagellar hook-basal body complex protein FliE [Granulicella sp.]|jgi:flagellar hook-basal body complex protein FliE|nr:flagellar hook-basal body complex protein FliE [Granulicella sp.]